MVTKELQGTNSMKARIMAAFSYLGILCFVPLIMNRDDEYVYFHSKQGVVIWMWGVLGVFAIHIPLIGRWVFNVSSLAVIVLSLIGLAAVVLHKAWKLPFVYNIAARIWI